MKRDGSNLSRDELCLVLSVCEQRAEEENAQLKKRLAVTEEAAGGAIVRCSEPGCGATRVSVEAGLHHFGCDELYSCEWGGSGCSRAAWCNRHAAGKFSICMEREDDGLVCKTCRPDVHRFYARACKWIPVVPPKEGSK
jgi:hypothetical protein